MNRNALSLEGRPGSRRRAGLTLVELMLALAAVGVLTALAYPVYHGHRERVQAADAATDIRGLSVMVKGFRVEYGEYPTQLSMAIQDGIPTDPWGNAYRYLVIEDAPPSVMGQTRKDKNLVPINSDFDLFSTGADAASQPPLMAGPSRDDIVRAADGAFIGLATEF